MDPLGVKRVVGIVQQHMGTLSPVMQQALEAGIAQAAKAGLLMDEGIESLEDAQALMERLGALVESLPEMWRPIATELLAAVAEGKVAAQTGGRVALRAGKTLQGLFPLTIRVQATPDSALGALLRDPQGKPGALTVTITPAHVPG